MRFDEPHCSIVGLTSSKARRLRLGTSLLPLPRNSSSCGRRTSRYTAQQLLLVTSERGQKQSGLPLSLCYPPPKGGPYCWTLCGSVAPAGITSSTRESSTSIAISIRSVAVAPCCCSSYRRPLSVIEEAILTRCLYYLPLWSPKNRFALQELNGGIVLPQHLSIHRIHTTNSTGIMLS